MINFGYKKQEDAPRIEQKLPTRGANDEAPAPPEVEALASAITDLPESLQKRIAEARKAWEKDRGDKQKRRAAAIEKYPELDGLI